MITICNNNSNYYS
uniref:Uncharacterized protein n=1 Tax=Amphimedon queenslandica TaxID=400682 RepID=A0A1X7UNJ9_AMPQE